MVCSRSDDVNVLPPLRRFSEPAFGDANALLGNVLEMELRCKATGVRDGDIKPGGDVTCFKYGYTKYKY